MLFRCFRLRIVIVEVIDSFYLGAKSIMLFHRVSSFSKAILLCGAVASLSACGELKYETSKFPEGYTGHTVTPLSHPYGTEDTRVDVKSMAHWEGVAEDVVNKMGMMARMQGKPIFLKQDIRNPRLERIFDYVLRDSLSRVGYQIADTEQEAYYTLNYSLDHADVESEENSDLVHVSAKLMLDEILVTDVDGNYRVGEIGEERWMETGWSEKLEPLPEHKINE